MNADIKKRLRTLLKKDKPCKILIWCLAHHLELALKDTLKEWMELILKPA